MIPPVAAARSFRIPCAVLIQALLFSCPAHAACERPSAPMATFRFEVPDTLIINPGDPVGTVLYTSNPVRAANGRASDADATDCAPRPPDQATRVGLVYPGGTPMDARTARLGGTNIGVQILDAASGSSTAWGPLEYAAARPPAGPAAGTEVDLARPLVLRLVKLGPITENAGDIPSGVFAYAKSDAMAAPGDAYFSLALANSPRFIWPSCQTPNLAVDLGEHPISQFTHAGYTTRLVPFAIKLQNCPWKVHRVRYYLQPTTGFNRPNSMIEINRSISTGNGVSIQLLDDQGGPVEFQQWTVYKGPVSGKNVDIPFQARLRQIEQPARMRAGSAITSLIFAIDYD